LLPRLFAHSIYQVEPKLASCLELAEWKGGTESLEQPLFAEADCVTATGSDQTLDAIRRRLPARARLVAYGHRLSFAYVSSDALARFEIKNTVQRAATDVAAWDQLGCLSPHVIYVEHGATVSPEGFAELLAGELATFESTQPRGKISTEEAATIASRRSFYEIRAASAGDVKLWQSDGSTAWSVVYEADAHFQISCLNRFVYVKPVAHLADALHQAEIVRGQVSTVGLGATGDKAQELATLLARWGVTRICPLGEMQTATVSSANASPSVPTTGRPLTVRRAECGQGPQRASRSRGALPGSPS
jgi:hypothetical protein